MSIRKTLDKMVVNITMSKAERKAVKDAGYGTPVKILKEFNYTSYDRPPCSPFKCLATVNECRSVMFATDSGKRVIKHDEKIAVDMCKGGITHVTEFIDV